MNTVANQFPNLAETVMDLRENVSESLSNYLRQHGISEVVVNLVEELQVVNSQLARPAETDPEGVQNAANELKYHAASLGEARVWFDCQFDQVPADVLEQTQA